MCSPQGCSATPTPTIRLMGEGGGRPTVRDPIRSCAFPVPRRDLWFRYESFLARPDTGIPVGVLTSSMK